MPEIAADTQFRLVALPHAVYKYAELARCYYASRMFDWLSD